MNLEEIGATLRAEREKKGLGIDDVADQLKINPRLLMALESGDAQALPHPAYARGFIRSYARLLGIGSDEVQSWLADAQPGNVKKPKVAQPEPESDLLTMPERKKGGGGRAFIVILVLCALGASAYWLWQSGKLPFLNYKKEIPAADVVKNLPGADTYQAERSLPAEVDEPKSAPVPISGPQPVSVAPSADQTAPVKEEEASREEAVAEKATSAEPATAATGAGESEAATDQHKLVIIATEECWVHSNADKTDTRQFSLRKGDTFALTFAHSLEIKLGNAGGVRLRYDGNDLPPPGSSGQVRTITFPPKES